MEKLQFCAESAVYFSFLLFYYLLQQLILFLQHLQLPYGPDSPLSVERQELRQGCF